MTVPILIIPLSLVFIDDVSLTDHADGRPLNYLVKLSTPDPSQRHGGWGLATQDYCVVS